MLKKNYTVEELYKEYEGKKDIKEKEKGMDDLKFFEESYKDLEKTSLSYHIVHDHIKKKQKNSNGKGDSEDKDTKHTASSSPKKNNKNITVGDSEECPCNCGKLVSELFKKWEGEKEGEADSIVKKQWKKYIKSFNSSEWEWEKLSIAYEFLLAVKLWNLQCYKHKDEDLKIKDPCDEKFQDIIKLKTENRYQILLYHVDTVCNKNWWE